MDYAIMGFGALLLFFVLYPTIMISLDKNIQNISGAEAAEIASRTKDLSILDVRTKYEFQMGHIQGAKNIPLSELGAKLGELGKSKGKPMLVYCASGRRSSKAVLVLSKNGHGPIHHLKRGLSGWPGPIKK